MSLPAPPPDAVARLLPPDVDLTRPARHGAARPVWLGMVWSRLARGDLAWEFWDRVGADEVQPWLAAERGRVLRELGLHSEAERFEWPALAAAEDPVDRAMLQVSLVADAVGRGDADAASRRLEVATEAVGALPDSPRAARQRLRLTWVGVEVAWVSGTHPVADGLPRMTGADGEVVLPADLRHGSSFHRSKALLFAGLVAGSLPLLDRALAEAPPVLTWAIHLARADHGADGALDDARRSWQQIVPPPPHADQVAATPTALRLARA
jgi:hypothetical protein